MTTFELTFNLTVMYSKAYRLFAGSYYQLIPLTIIIQACIGYIVVYFLLQGKPTFWDMIQLFCCVAATNMYLGAILGQIHVKKIFALFFIGLVVNIVLLAIQLI
jgi:hypothetical protein|tara:strand:+ start:1675 stop:1986 length:312 start_codon:yes stop_codon:yes gene_type:complete